MTERVEVNQPSARWPWQRSLQARILLMYGSVFGVVLALLMLVIGRAVYQAQLANAQQALEVEAFLAANALQDPLSGYADEFKAHERDDDQHDDDKHDRDKAQPTPTSTQSQVSRSTPVPASTSSKAAGRLQRVAGQYAADTGARVTILDALGHPLADSAYAADQVTNQLAQPEVQAALHGEARPDVRRDPLSGTVTLFVATPVRQADRLLGLIQMGRPMQEVAASAWALLFRLGMFGLLALLLVTVLAVGLTRYLVRPVQALEKAAIAVADGDMGQQVPVTTADELGALARAFNGMVDSLRRMLEQQRLFVANASHELRTPLTNIKLRSEALLDGPTDPAVHRRYLTEIDREADRLGRLAAVLLDLSSLTDSGSRLPPAPVDILPVLHEVIDVMHLRTAQAGLTLTLDAPAQLPQLRVRPEELEAVLLNLLDNAVKYTPAPGAIALTAQADGSRCRLCVRDSGMGIAPEELPFIFERFYRVDKARTRGAAGLGVGSGAGLGLSIARALVEQNGGTIRAESTVGQGSVFEIEFAV